MKNLVKASATKIGEICLKDQNKNSLSHKISK